jgi:hypothetical protein
MKKIFAIMFFWLIASQVDAVVRYWYNTGGNDLWTNGANWGDSFNIAPQSADIAIILNGQAPIGNTHTCQFIPASTTSVAGVQVQAMGYNGLAGMELSSGTLVTDDFFIGSGGPGSGVVIMNGGKIICKNYFVVGQNGGNGTLTMTGGTINANNFWVSNLANSKGTVRLSGGTINISGTISIQGKNDAGFASESTGYGLIDISGGQIVFTKDQDLTPLVDHLSSEGLITAYGGRGVLVATRDSISGYTIISSVVPDPMTLKTDINGDLLVNIDDLVYLGEQWLNVPASPSADIYPNGGDGMVNLSDFAAFAGDFGSLSGKVLSNGNFYLNTPYYEIEISPNPARIFYVNWDIQGHRNYSSCIIPNIPNTSWVSTLYAGINGYTNNIAKAAENITYTKYPGRSEMLLSNIYILPNLKADWLFTFYPDYFKHEIIWKAQSVISGLCNLGHQWITAKLTDGAGDEIGPRKLDVTGFSRYAYVNDDAVAFKMDFEANSTLLQANRYYLPSQGVLWQNILGSGAHVLPAGSHQGGRWVCKGVPVQDVGLRPSKYIAKFIVPGQYFKDFYFLKENGIFHLFYNVGKAGPTQDWGIPGNEQDLGHATSSDLVNWIHHNRVIPIIPGTWEGTCISAPSIVKVGDNFKMTYTGFDANGCQRIGLASSDDLFNWTRYPNPVYEGPAWTNWRPDGWADCRDADLVEYNGNFLMYTMVTPRLGSYGAVAVAKSSDLIHWTDLGAAVTDPVWMMESPHVIERNGYYYLFNVCAGHVYKSADPEATNWPSIPFEWVPGSWAAYEVLYDKDQDKWIVAAFKWTLYGNEIRFWELTWDGDQPKIVYE